MDFYEQKPDKFLRFGDVVRGYITADVCIKEPLLKLPYECDPYRIDISTHPFYVVLTPCCSIEDGSITITPIIPLRSSFVKNPFFADDFTRINSQMHPEQTLSADEWATLDLGRKEELVREGKNYTLLQLFVYAPNPYFKPYQLRGREITHYMIDFKNVHEVNCSLIQRPEKIRAPDSYQSVSDSKILQLTVSARTDLRNKLTNYFSRKAKEDIVPA